MANKEIKLNTISPMFLTGADTRTPDDLRAPSIRGQIRYWFRALEGANTPDIEELWKLEKKLLGSTSGGSQVSVRFFKAPPDPFDEGKDVERKAMLPHRSDPVERSLQKAIKIDTPFRLNLVTRPGVDVPPQVLNACAVWLLLGGLGKRSRRMFGAFNLTWAGKISTPQELAKLINRYISAQIDLKKLKPMPNQPKFPMLHPSHSRIIVGTESFDHEELVIDLFKGLLRTPKYLPFSKSFGYTTKDERRASPVIAQARKIGEKYYPILTVMHSEPNGPINWSKVKEFMNDASTRWKCVEAWGEWR
jgi:CRISPR-associated protein Cmr1